jgi:tetratricopeptide (TPR) repeat protein
MTRSTIRDFSLALALVLLCACRSSDENGKLHVCLDPSAAPRQVVSSCNTVLNAGGLKREDVAQAHFHRGLAFDLLGNHDKAMADFDRVVELDPESVQARIHRGYVLANRGDLNAAMQDFLRAVELDPNDIYALVNVANTYERQGDMERSLDYYERAVAAAPDFSGAVGGRCWILAVLNRDLDQAVSDCSKALALPPQNDAVFTANQLNSRGFAYFRQKKYTEAITDYDRSLELAPQSASSYYVRGVARIALGDQSAGDSDILRARQIDPNVAARYAGFGVEP